MPVLLSLASALAFGAGDFLGGLAARRAPALAAAFLAQLAALVLLVALAPWTLDGVPPRAVLAWGAAAGLAGGLAALTLYPALALGDACEVAPLSALIGTALPVLAGVLGGERPSALAWAGIALAAVTIVLVSADGHRTAPDPARRLRALRLAALAGLAIGAFLIAFERAGPHGIAPLLVARAASVPLFALALLVRRTRPWPAGVSPAPALATGVLDVAANSAFLLALARGPLSLVATLTNLYPAATVLCGMLFLGERPRPAQRAGLVLALLAIALIAR